MRKSASFIIWALTLSAVLFIGYYAFPGEKSIEKKITETSSFGYEDVKNALYDGVPLIDGRSNGNERGEASVNSWRSVVLVPEFSASGDINGDGTADLAILAVEDFGGSGSFNYVALYYSRDGSAEYAGKIFLGDRIRVRSVSMEENDLVSVVMVSHAPEDPLVSPSKLVSIKYEVRSDGPVEVSREDLGRIYEEIED